MGLGINDDKGLAKIRRWVCAFVSKLDPSTSPEELECLMIDSHKLDAKCTQLTTQHDNYASYNVEVMCDNVAEMYNPEKWPAGVYLGRKEILNTKNN